MVGILFTGSLRKADFGSEPGGNLGPALTHCPALVLVQRGEDSCDQIWALVTEPATVQVRPDVYNAFLSPWSCILPL